MYVNTKDSYTNRNMRSSKDRIKVRFLSVLFPKNETGHEHLLTVLIIQKTFVKDDNIVRPYFYRLVIIRLGIIERDLIKVNRLFYW